MKPKFEVGLVVGCLLFAIFGATCAAEGGEAVTIIDQMGRNVTVIPEEIERIMIFSPPPAAMIYAIEGTGERIKGMNPLSKQAIKDGILGEMAPELLDADTSQSMEEILKIDPDIIFMPGPPLGTVDEIQLLEDLGFPVVVMSWKNQDEYETLMSNVGRVLGRDDRANMFINYHRAMHEGILAITENLSEEERPSVMFLPFPKSLTTVPGTIVTADYIDIAGGVITTKELTMATSLSVTMEQVIKWNPDVILLGNFEYVNPQDLYDNSLEGQDWSSIKAVQNRQVYLVPLGVYRWGPPNHESPLMWMWLGEILHPDLFDFDLRSEIKDFYQEMYDYDLSEEQIDNILHCDVNSVSVGYEAFC